MADSLQRIRVFIASPGDVMDERDRVERVVNELNRTIAPRHDIYIDLIRWETHARAGFGADAQDVINQQMLQGERHPADVFIGIMWKRLGTPTNRAESGTAEEFERAYDSWQRFGNPAILFYFNTTPYYFRTPDEFEQFTKVMKFREDLTQKGGLVWEYQSADEFESRLREHLAREVLEVAEKRRAERAAAQPVAAPAAEPVPAPRQRIDNLPVQATRLIGRERELATIVEALASRDIRLVTLCGPAGVGKTRLAVQAAADAGEACADGVCFVSLETVVDPELIAPAIAQALDLREAGDQPLAQTLSGFLKTRQLLLVLDNFEQLRGATQLVRELLDSCPQLKMIVTTRVQLHLRGERKLEVLPLAPPTAAESADLAALGANAAVQLFVEWAQAARPDFELTPQNAPAVAEIIRRLDGLPLGLELIAARLRSLPLPAILQRLQQSLALLGGRAGGMSEGQRTLLAAIGSSYDLLGPAEQTLFRELSVFANGWTLEAMEAVVSAGFDAFDSLSGLIDHSLVRLESESSADPRYLMLETIRGYAAERRRELDDDVAIQRRHAEFYLALAEDAAKQLTGPQQAQWLERLDAEYDNLRAALRSACDAFDAPLAMRIGAALWRFWSTRGYLTEGRAHLNEVLALPGASDDALLRARVCAGAGWLAQEEDNYDDARAHSEEALALLEGRADARGLAALPYLCLGAVALKQRELDVAQAQWAQAESIAREVNDRWSLANAILYLGFISMMNGDLPAAKETFERGLMLARQLGDRFVLVRALGNLGRIALAEGQVDAAHHFYQEALSLSTQLGDRRLRSIALINCGYVADERAEYDQALKYFTDALSLSQELGNRLNAVQALEQIGTTWMKMGQLDRAARIFGTADALRLTHGFPRNDREQEEQDAIVATMRDTLGGATFSAITTLGHHMTIEDAIEYVRNEIAALAA